MIFSVRCAGVPTFPITASQCSHSCLSLLLVTALPLPHHLPPVSVAAPPQSRLLPMKNNQLITLTAPTCQRQMHRRIQLHLRLLSNTCLFKSNLVIRAPCLCTWIGHALQAQMVTKKHVWADGLVCSRCDW